MPYSLDGSKPTARELKAYADKLLERLEAFQRESAEMTAEQELDNKNEIRLLAKQHQMMNDDLKEMSRNITKLTDAIHDLVTNEGILESKHNELHDTIVRAHKRIDRLEVEYKNELKDFQKENREFHKENLKAIQGLQVRIARAEMITAAAGSITTLVVGSYIIKLIQ